MKIAQIQMHVTPDKTENLRRAAALLEQAGPTDMAVLPEMFCCPYDNRCFRAYGEAPGGEAYQFLSALAREKRLWLVGGSVPELSDDTKKKLVFDKLEINLDSYELLVDGKKVDTPPKELELLYHLAATPNRVYTRNQLLDEVWGFDYFGDSRTVDVHIKRLREKIENVSDQWELKTVWGVGYKFEVK